jgi:hypothetical protein
MPSDRALPASIADLATVNAKTISDRNFREDVGSLAAIISKDLADATSMNESEVRVERERLEQMIKEDLANNRREGPVSGRLDPDRTKFLEDYVSDAKAWRKIHAAGGPKPIAFPEPRGLPEPILRLSDALGPGGADAVRTIHSAGEIVFHAVGSTGNIRGPADMALVTDRMTQEFRERDGKSKPSFLFHLGDVIYMFGEAKYYYDQFYVPYRQYPAPIFVMPGNHDGMVVPGSNRTSLDAFCENFCAEGFHEAPSSRGLGRTAQIQPGVYFTLEAPFVRILALYSNILEGPGVISDQEGTFPELDHAQLQFLEAALHRVREEKFAGAVILAVHHNLYSPRGGRGGGSSSRMLGDLDSASKKTGVWPHAVLSGHFHNYQRYTRTVSEMHIPYLVAGSGGYGVSQLVREGGSGLSVPRRLPLEDDDVTLENYRDQHYGYLRITADPKRLHIAYQTTLGALGDSVTLSLRTRKIVRG